MTIKTKYVDSLVVGSCVSSLLYSYKNNIPILISTYRAPTKDLIFKKPILLNDLKFLRHQDLWFYLKFSLSMRGLVANPEQPRLIKLGKINVKFDCNGKVSVLEFNRCRFYQDEIVKCDFEFEPTSNRVKYKVLDFMIIKTGTHKGVRRVACDIGHVKDIVLDGSEVIAVSELSEDQINNFDYSDTISRFITQKALEQAGLVTMPFVDKDKKFKRKLLLEVTKRDVIPLGKITYKDTGKVKIIEPKRL